MIALYLSYEESREGGDAINPEDNWPNYTDTHITFWLTKVGLSSETATFWKEMVEVKSFTTCLGMPVFVVVVRYATGDTFGTICGAWTVIGVYQQNQQALAVKKQIEQDTYRGYKPWQGYFESLEGVEITELVIEA